MTTITLSPQQSDFVEALLHTTSHLALRARAGCGKTFTIIQAVQAFLREHPSAELGVTAYNTKIKDEVKGKLEELKIDWRSCSADTAHGMGFGLLRFRFKLTRDDINKNKVADIVRSLQDRSKICRDQAEAIGSLVAKAKLVGFGAFEDLPIANTGLWRELALAYDLDDFDDEATFDRVIEASKYVYKLSLQDTTQVDFDDMVLLPLYYRIRVRFTKDVLFVDEAQDLSRVRRSLLRMFVKERTGRIVIVGDNRQAIYAFSGADCDSFDLFVKEWSAMVYPLDVTRRCPKSVVSLAQTIVPDFTAHEDAPEGFVGSLDTLPPDLGPGDAILCRNTAPLITLAYGLIKRRVPCKVEGKEIGQGLVFLVRKWKVKTTAALTGRLDGYLTRELAKLAEKPNKDEQKMEALRDKVESLKFIISECEIKNKHSVDDAVDFINSLFGEDVTGCVVLCTYHRSKGREWLRVFLLDHHQHCPSKYAKKPEQKQQEENLAYVAYSRAMESLYFVPGKFWDEDFKEAA